jgi:hypothetical protein
MAIISCPACAKKISSAAATCQYCNCDFHSSDVEQAVRNNRRKLRNKKNRLHSLAILCIIIFTAGVVMSYEFVEFQGAWQLALGNFMLAGGFVGFGVVRVLMALNKRQIKALKGN